MHSGSPEYLDPQTGFFLLETGLKNFFRSKTKNHLSSSGLCKAYLSNITTFRRFLSGWTFPLFRILRYFYFSLVFAVFRISPDSIAELFEALASYKNGVIEVRVSGQQQQRMGYR
jgi:hypothetical protein